MIKVKKEIIKNFLQKDLIDKKQDNEISKFGDLNLRMDLKIAYDEIVQEKRMKFKKKDEVLNIDQTEVLKTLNKPKNNNDDFCNLTFLKQIHTTIVKSKIKLLLQYLRNIDTKLFKYFKDLIDEYEKENLILILIELKLFLNELISYYVANSSEVNEMIYEYKIYTETNVISK